MNTEKLEKLKKSLDNKFIPDNMKDKIRAEIKKLEADIKTDETITATEVKEEVKEIEKKVEKALEVAEEKEEQAEAKKEEAQEKAEAKAEEKKAKNSRTKTPKTDEKPKSAKKSVFSIAKEIRKDNESWEEAKDRARKMMKSETTETKKKTKTETQRLLAMVRRNKEYKKLAGTSNLPKDATRRALPRGKRISKITGDVYYENRANRVDVGGFKNAYLENGGYAERGVYVETLDEEIDLTDDGIVKATKTQKGGNKSFGELREMHGASPEALAFDNGGTIIGTPETPLGRDLGIDYTGLVGETGGMSAGEMFAEGGSLGNHGLKQGDQIIKTMSGGVQKVKTKSGDIVYVNLANGYRGAEPPLPFAKGGGVTFKNGREYSTGRNWTNDHIHVNKSEKHEVNYNRKRSFDDGGQIEKSIRFTKNDYERLVRDSSEDYPFYSTKNGINQEIYKEKNEKKVAVWNSNKETLRLTNDSDLIDWLERNSYEVRKYDDGGLIEGFNPKSFSLAEIDEKLRDNDIYIQWLAMGDSNTSADKRDFLWTNTSTSTEWNKVKDLRLTISDYGLLELSKGSENLYLNFVVYEKDGYDPMNIQIYTKDNHAGLKQFARQIVDKFEEGGFMTDPNFGDFQNGVYAEKGAKVDNQFNYMMLSRLQMDCDYYLGYGNRNEKVLWAGNVDDHIAEMKKLWNSLPKNEKPEWLTMNDILDYEKKMKSDNYATGGVTKNYINRNQLNTITIKKGDQKLTYKVSDVYNGAYKLEDGGNLEKTAFYVSKRNIVKVQLKDGKDVKVANGYWIKKGAKPIHISKYDDGGETEYTGGGKTTFKEKATAIAKNFEGKKVEPKYQKEYGKTYDKAEAKEVGNKIAGSQKAKYDSKMSGGGKTKRGGAMQLAKQIRKDGESWQSALKRANEQMRKK